MKSTERKTNAKYMRNFVFGVEDSLVSTVGMLSGVAVAGMVKSEILLIGIILIFVEAFSMGVGSLLSEHTADEYIQQKDLPMRASFSGGVIMFFSYFFAGFIPLFPYLFWEPSTALILSVVLALITLFTLGGVSAKIYNVSILKHGFEMFIIGGAATLIGVIVAKIVEKV